jgi:hypothetical protein
MQGQVPAFDRVRPTPEVLGLRLVVCFTRTTSGDSCEHSVGHELGEVGGEAAWDRAATYQ